MNEIINTFNQKKMQNSTTKIQGMDGKFYL